MHHHDKKPSYIHFVWPNGASNNIYQDKREKFVERCIVYCILQFSPLKMIPQNNDTLFSNVKKYFI